MTSYTTTVLEYFAAKAEHYDDVVHQTYWQLSDALLWERIEQDVLSRCAAAPRLLDAGGGTGRWTERFLTASPTATGVVFDLSQDMLAQAQRKADSDALRGRMEVHQGDLSRLTTDFPVPAFDVVFCFHNVLGFVADPASVVRQFAAVLRPGGLLAMVVPNRYHMAFFSLFRGDAAEAHSVWANHRGRFTPDMPAIAAFTPRELGDLVAAAGLVDPFLTGFPSLIYPGYAETQLHGESAQVRHLLQDQQTFRDVLALERIPTATGEAAARGNNLLVIATKPASNLDGAR